MASFVLICKKFLCRAFFFLHAFDASGDQSLFKPVAEKLLQAFVSTRFTYSSSGPLAVQNNAAWALMHWLPVHLVIDLKIFLHTSAAYLHIPQPEPGQASCMSFLD